MNTYRDNATNYELWLEYVDTDGTTTKEEFESMEIWEKIHMQIRSFGADNDNMTASDAREIILAAATDETVVAWSNDSKAEIADDEGNLWVNGERAEDEQLIEFAGWLANQL